MKEILEAIKLQTEIQLYVSNTSDLLTEMQNANDIGTEDALSTQRDKEIEQLNVAVTKLKALEIVELASRPDSRVGTKLVSSKELELAKSTIALLREDKTKMEQLAKTNADDYVHVVDKLEKLTIDYGHIQAANASLHKELSQAKAVNKKLKKQKKYAEKKCTELTIKNEIIRRSYANYKTAVDNEAKMYKHQD